MPTPSSSGTTTSAASSTLATAGLRIEFLREYDFTDIPFHGLERGEDGLWRIPADQFQIPLMFSLPAAKDPARGD